MERKTDMDAHLDIADIIRLAMEGEYDSHFSDCVFCREQYEDARDLEMHVTGDMLETDLTIESDRFVSDQYRLAAQSTDEHEVASTTHVRRTWYLERGDVILRVMEDTERQILYGHLIMDPARLPAVVIRFIGMEQAFSPDDRGLFDIGSASLEIERMEVEISRLDSSQGAD